MKSIKQGLKYAGIIIILYLAVGYLLHLVVFPEKKPDISTYFTEGNVFYSKSEGVLQTVVSQSDGYVKIKLEVQPFAPGPPKHKHSHFDEYYEVENGELSMWLDGEIKTLRPGTIVHIPKGAAHKFSNETSETIHLKRSLALPEEFAFYLSQVYGLMDNSPDFGKMPATLFMMAPIQQAGFDSHLVDGPPVFVQKIISFLLTPAARLMGYKSYYEEFHVDGERGEGRW